MFCPECGTDAGDFNFCSNCGTKIPKVSTNQSKSNLFLKQAQDKIKDAVQWFKAQEPKKQKIIGISAVLVIVLLFVFAVGGTGSGVKEQLCDGVWCRQYQFEGSSFTTVDFGPWLDTSVYEFKPNNTFTAYFGTYYFSDIGSLLNVPMEVSYTGKYSIDEDRCQIKLISPDGGETKEIPYAINEYTHELMFDVNSSGKTSYWHEDSLEDGLAWYDMVH